MPALILEAIAQSSPVTDPQGRIERYDLRLLPALPASLHGGELQGLRLRGGFSLDISWRNGVVEAYVVHNPFDRKYRIVH
ncbi:glycoside hydrolase family 95-like protein [Cohnella ginsengisoli]|uniref:glycoside hydrolase family 95-like protein n=1 Tax=Cohnella ginsengisoli TaxID=425004 RepID=UPI003B8A8F9D